MAKYKIAALLNQIEVNPGREMAKTKKVLLPVYSRTYTDDEGQSIWTYDPNITLNGPISVEMVYNVQPPKRAKKNKPS